MIGPNSPKAGRCKQTGRPLIGASTACRLDRRDVLRAVGHCVLGQTVLAGLLVAAGPADRASAGTVHSLVMIEDAGCVYCVRWHAEVGDAYANSAEGRFAPLDRRRIGDPDIAALRNVRYTPTFVLMRGTVEIGRITGYPGPDPFWELLAGLMAKAGFNTSPAPPPVDDIKT
jgi:hypothetical protein